MIEIEVPHLKLANFSYNLYSPVSNFADGDTHYYAGGVKIHAKTTSSMTTLVPIFMTAYVSVGDDFRFYGFQPMWGSTLPAPSTKKAARVVNQCKWNIDTVTCPLPEYAPVEQAATMYPLSTVEELLKHWSLLSVKTASVSPPAEIPDLLLPVPQDRNIDFFPYCDTFGHLCWPFLYYAGGISVNIFRKELPPGDYITWAGYSNTSRVFTETHGPSQSMSPMNPARGLIQTYSGSQPSMHGTFQVRSPYSINPCNGLQVGLLSGNFFDYAEEDPFSDVKQYRRAAEDFQLFYPFHPPNASCWVTK